MASTHLPHRSIGIAAPQSANRRIWQILVYLILGGMTALIGGGQLLGDDRMTLTGVSLLPLIAPAVYQYASRESELFSPLNFVFLNFVIGSFLQTVALCYSRFYSSSLLISPDTDYELLMVGASTLFAASLFLVSGYALAGGLGSGNVNRRASVRALRTDAWMRNRVRIAGIVFGAISLASLLYYIAVFDVLSDLSRLSVKRSLSAEAEGSGLVNLTRFGMRFAQVASVAIYAYHLVAKREGLKRSGLEGLLLALLLISFVGPLLASSRSSLLFQIIALFAVHRFVRGDWRLSQIRNALILVLVIVTAMGAVRYVQQRSSTLDNYGADIGVGGTLTKLALSNSFVGVAKTSVLMDTVPSPQPYTYGSTYTLWAVAPIPRAMWSDKPVIRIGGILGSQVFGSRETNGIPPGFVGEAWLNFGPLGVPLVAFLFGLGLRTYFERFGRRSSTDLGALLIYATTFTVVSFSLLSSDFSGTVTRAAQILIPAVGMLWFVRNRAAPEIRKVRRRSTSTETPARARHPRAAYRVNGAS